jgi:hypothetical protein
VLRRKKPKTLSGIETYITAPPNYNEQVGKHRYIEESGLFRTYCANFLGKCQKSNARISKFIKFLNPKPHLFNSFNLVLIPSTIPLVLIQNTPQFLPTIF